MTFRFKDFDVYKDSLALVDLELDLINRFTTCKLFSYNDQLHRATSSILLNIAEGSSPSRSRREFTRYLQISLGSVYEIVAIVDIALKMKIISSAYHRNLFDSLEKIAKQLSALSRSLGKGHLSE